MSDEYTSDGLLRWRSVKQQAVDVLEDLDRRTPRPLTEEERVEALAEACLLVASCGEDDAPSVVGADWHTEAVEQLRHEFGAPDMQLWDGPEVAAFYGRIVDRVAALVTRPTINTPDGSLVCGADCSYKFIEGFPADHRICERVTGPCPHPESARANMKGSGPCAVMAVLDPDSEVSG